jgi:ABC-type bacteriocin/lantibiotic exporter with double-glycine peptidase domain
MVMEKGLEFKNLTAFLQFLNNCFQGGGTVAIVYYGYVLESADEITIGKLTSFLFFQSMLVWQFWIIFWVFFNLAGMIGSGELVSVFIQTNPSIWG